MVASEPLRCPKLLFGFANLSSLFPLLLFSSLSRKTLGLSSSHHSRLLLAWPYRGADFCDPSHTKLCKPYCSGKPGHAAVPRPDSLEAPIEYKSMRQEQRTE
jgi:hypothetical protein